MNEVHFKDIDKIISKNLNEAKFEIKIAVAWITDLYLINSLTNCLKKGIKVYIIFFDDKINNLDLFEGLYNLGAEIRCTKNLMHNKFCVIDKKITLNGSYNWTVSAKRNNENIQVTNSISVSFDFLKEFDKLYLKSLKVDKHFANNVSSFNIYLGKQGKPNKYPVFFKQTLNDDLRKIIFNINRNALHNDFKFPIQHIYKLFFNETEYIEYHKKVYNYLYTKNQDFFSDSILYCKIKNVFQSSGNPYNSGKPLLVLDLIFDVTKIDNLNSSYILENKPKFSYEKFIYFNPIMNSNFLLIGVENISIYEINNFGLQNIFKIGVFAFDIQENKNIITFKFGNLTINNEYIINSYIQNISYYNEISGFESKNNKYDYNIFINKSNFTLNHKLEKENNDNNIKKLKKDETDRI